MKVQNSYDLSYVFVGLNPEKWEANYVNIAQSVAPYTFEFIIVSPNFPTVPLQQQMNVKFIRDFGHPSRCLQIGSMIAVGEMFSWGSEDYRAKEHGIAECIELLRSSDKLDVINMLYSEGPGYTGSQYLDENYWKPYTHPPLRQKHVKPEWGICMTPLLRLATFRTMGGIDCSYEHFNFNVHDLMFRIQNGGGKIIKSNGRIYAHDHVPQYVGDHMAFEECQAENDMPRFIARYSQPTIDMGPIPYNNWMFNTENIWHRRFKRYVPS
jgi:hypothetical protein